MKTQKHLLILIAFLLAIPGIAFSDGLMCGGGSPPPGQPNPSQPMQACEGDPGDNSDDAPQDDGDQFDSTGNSDPVSMSTGALQFSMTDLKLPGIMPLVFTRCYDSTMLYAGALGNNWDFSFNRRLSFESGNLYYHTGQGYEIQLTYTSTTSAPTWVDPVTGVASAILAQSTNQHNYTVIYNSTSNQYTVIDVHDNKDIFDSLGHLIKSLDRYGNELDYTRDTAGNLIEVEDPVHGTSMTFDLDTNGYITSVTASDGRMVSFTYDSNYNLTEVTYPATTDFPSGTNVQYAYDCDHRMTSETDGNGVTYLTNTYGAQGTADEFKVVSQTYRGHTATFDYHDVSLDFSYRHSYGGVAPEIAPSPGETTFTDYKGFVTDYYYNPLREITQKVVHTTGLHSGAPSTYVTNYTYDSKSNKTQETDPNGNGMRWTYDGNNNCLTATKFSPTGVTVDPSMGTQVLTSTTTSTFESRFNQVATKTDPNGNVTTYNYGTASSNPKGSLLTITYPTTAAGTAQETFTYNSLGQVLTDTTPDGTVTQNTYDSSTGYLTKRIADYGSGKLNATTQYTYDTYGHIASVKDPNGNTTTFTTNAMDQITEKDGAEGEVEKFSYDGDGRVIVNKRQAPGSEWQETDSVYDSNEDLTGVKKYTGSSTYLETTFTYDADDNRITVTDPLSNTITTAYDERNLPYLVTDALGNTTQRDFDGNGNTVKLTDELTHVSCYKYDGLDRLEKKTFPDSSYQTWKYDATGNVTSLLTTAGNTIAQTYDTRNRMLTQNYGSTITNAYDIMGRVLTTTEGGTSLTYVYDALGRNTSFTDQAGLVSTYTYDLDGHRLNSTYPTSVKVKRAYDASNRLATLKDGSDTTMATFSYDSLDRTTGVTLANSTTISYGYDLLNRLGYVDNTLGSGNRNYSYVYDNASRVTSTTEPRGTIASSYSQRNEVTGITEPSGSPFADQTFAYDAGWNRSSWTLGSSTTTYAVNNLNQYSTVSGSTAPTWNTDGGLHTFAGNTYIYDALQRLTEVDYSAGKTLFTYDPLGRRVKKVDENSGGTVLSTFSYHYDGSEVAVEYQPSTTWTYYLGLGLDQVVLRDSGSAKEWYYRDGHGSTSAVTDNSGNVLENYEYNAQGQWQITNGSGTVESTTQIANDLLYTGRNYDYETGNYFYRARYYNPTLGRFISRDPLSGAEFSQGTNLYAYCRNNHLNANDPTGMCPEDGTLTADGNYYQPPPSDPNSLFPTPTNAFDATLETDPGPNITATTTTTTYMNDGPGTDSMGLPTQGNPDTVTTTTVSGSYTFNEGTSDDPNWQTVSFTTTETTDDFSNGPGDSSSSATVSQSPNYLDDAGSLWWSAVGPPSGDPSQGEIARGVLDANDSIQESVLGQGTPGIPKE